MIGDRMDTDIVAGLEAGLRTVLVLSGISTADSVTRFLYCPHLVVESVAELAGPPGDPFGNRGRRAGRGG